MSITRVDPNSCYKGKNVSLKRKFSIKNYNFLLTQAVALKEIKKVEKLFNEIQQKKLKPNIYTYNILLNAYLKDEKLETAIKLLNEMQEQEMYPTIVTFNSFLHFFVQKTFSGESFDSYVQRMIEEEFTSFYTRKYLTILKDFAKKAHSDEILSLVKSLEVAGLKPDVGTFNCMLTLFVKQHNMRGAYKIMDEMCVREIEPDKITYTLLIDLYLIKERIGEALTLMKEMSSKGFIPKRLGCQTLLNLLIRKDRLDDVKILLKEMEKLQLKFDTETSEHLRAFLQKKGENPLYLCAFNKSEE